MQAFLLPDVGLCGECRGGERRGFTALLWFTTLLPLPGCVLAPAPCLPWLPLHKAFCYLGYTG